MITTNLGKEMHVDNDDSDDQGAAPTSAVIAAHHTQSVLFYEDRILLVEGPDGQIYVPLRPIATFLGLDWASQYARTRRDVILAAEMRTIRLDRQQSAGGAPEVVGLPLDYLNGWLFKIDTRRVKPTLQDKILRYQRECYRVLARAFQVDPPASSAPPTEGSMSLAQIRELGVALQELADRALLHETRIAHVEGRLDNAARFMGHIQKRLEQVEERVAPGALLTAEQEAALNSRVKALGVILASLGQRNPWQGIWTELFRHLGVSDSKHIPQAKFAPAMDFLETWVRSLTTAEGAPPA